MGSQESSERPGHLICSFDPSPVLSPTHSKNKIFVPDLPETWFHLRALLGHAWGPSCLSQRAGPPYLWTSTSLGEYKGAAKSFLSLNFGKATSDFHIIPSQPSNSQDLPLGNLSLELITSWLPSPPKWWVLCSLIHNGHILTVYRKWGLDLL